MELCCLQKTGPGAWSSGLGIWGSGSGVWGLGLGIWDLVPEVCYLGSVVWNLKLGSGIWNWGYGIWCLRSAVWDLWVLDSRSGIEGLVFRIQVSWSEILGR